MSNRVRSCVGYTPVMATVRSCRVTMMDLDGVSHTVRVTASTLYEAIRAGRCGHSRPRMGGQKPGGDFTQVKVSVMSIPVEHTVQIRKFVQWIEKNGGSPREVLDRAACVPS